MWALPSHAQRMKGQTGAPVSAVAKDQLETPGDDLAESWRHRQQQAATAPGPAPSYAPTTDPYGYYGTAGTYQYQAFGVGDGTWSANGADQMTFLGGYAQPDTYVEGAGDAPAPSVRSPFFTPFVPTPFSATFNYFHGNGDYASTWGQTKQYDDYYRPDQHYAPDAVKPLDQAVQGLSLDDHKSDKQQQHDPKDQPKKTWATIASQPAKPQPPAQTSALKKKGPGMPPPPIVPGKHNMDIGTWETAKSETPPVCQSQLQQQQQLPQSQPPPRPQPVRHQPLPQPPQQQHQHQHQLQHQLQHQPPPTPSQHPWAGNPPQQRAPPPRAPQPPPPPAQTSVLPHPVLDRLRNRNNYNPAEFDLSARDARFFVIKSYSEDDIHRSIKYEIWCSTEHGNKRLDAAFRERTKDGAQGVVYLFFSVNGSGHFCGMAQMVSAVDYKSNSNVWAQDKWKGQFKVRWVYVKDVPNMQLRHIRLENNENKPVTNSRDTQEIPHARGLQVLRLMHGYRHSTSIFDDFVHYEKRQEEEDLRKAPEVSQQGQHRDGDRDAGKHHQGYENKHHDSYGGVDKNHYGRDHGGGFGRDHGGFSKDHGHGGGGGFHKDHVNFHRDQGVVGHGKDHGNDGDGYGGGGHKGHRGGDRDQHGGGYRDHRDQSGGGGYRSHKDKNDSRGGGGRGRGRPN